MISGMIGFWRWKSFANMDDVGNQQGWMITWTCIIFYESHYGLWGGIIFMSWAWKILVFVKLSLWFKRHRNPQIDQKLVWHGKVGFN
jgi:hypothetical protein